MGRRLDDRSVTNDTIYSELGLYAGSPISIATRSNLPTSRRQFVTVGLGGERPADRRSTFLAAGARAPTCSRRQRTAVADGNNASFPGADDPRCRRIGRQGELLPSSTGSQTTCSRHQSRTRCDVRRLLNHVARATFPDAFSLVDCRSMSSGELGIDSAIHGDDSARHHSFVIDVGRVHCANAENMRYRASIGTSRCSGPGFRFARHRSRSITRVRSYGCSAALVGAVRPGQTR